ncbi:unnamed protein product [Brachionus calyciflorus]|uniref:Uncharacterized protein n=1 Tax=Brachionus calyciflorus TaxID=104777 RepID=A0A813T4C6_9BILA|nr:unnamed protein product [Brachionus calyciflorus]
MTNLIDFEIDSTLNETEIESSFLKKMDSNEIIMLSNTPKTDHDDLLNIKFNMDSVDQVDRTELFLAKVNAHITSQILGNHRSHEDKVEDDDHDDDDDDDDSSFFLHKDITFSISK